MDKNKAKRLIMDSYARGTKKTAALAVAAALAAPARVVGLGRNLPMRHWGRDLECVRKACGRHNFTLHLMAGIAQNHVLNLCP